ncbi:prepilin-type N-terminal cleavage/methylation domain-containing protein [Sodalis sp. dw_96]|uniref:prepilin-type N-terminal cleavage/methylation domain-containing protein n=1 Tax=Sodalis sp. dw_96 TaxID=2719794 RepID=UPI001BD6B71E|nr:prepilin-type N-terminal cleavage/methylation domain-containing protein [Sodalis sp. dw_96]
MKKPIPSQQGYTLIEMMLVLSLVALIALTGGFSWQHYRHQSRLSEAGQQIADFLSRWQLHAVRNNHSCRIGIKTGADAELTAVCHSRPDERFRFRPPLVDIRLEVSSPGYLTFRGLHNTATPAHVAISNPAGSIKIIVSGTGRLRLCSVKGRFGGIPPC